MKVSELLRVITLLAALDLFVSAPALSYALPEQHSVWRNAECASVIALGNLVRAQPDAVSNSVAQGMVFNMSPSGTYTYSVLTVLKGQIPATISVRLTMTAPIYYGWAEFGVRDVPHCILLLNRDSAGNLVPVDPTTPVIPISPGVTVTNLGARNARVAILKALIDSCEDPMYRKEDAWLLRTTLSPLIPLGLEKYIDDTDLQCRDNVLYCLGVNQDLRAIEPIIKLADTYWLKGEAPACVTLLRAYKENASRLIAPLLVSVPPDLRSNAAFAIARNAPDVETLPYLLLALNDPDPIGDIPYLAYRTIHRLAPVLGASDDWPYYLAHRDGENQEIRDWWKIYLQNGANAGMSGKHYGVQSAFQTTVNQLIDPLSANRMSALSKISSLKPHDQYACLMLATLDPSLEIRHAAYEMLATHIDGATRIVTPAQYSKSEVVLLQKVYNWWPTTLGSIR